MSGSNESTGDMSPPLSITQYENQLIILAMRQAEHQLKNKTASSQTLAYYLDLASKRESVKLKKLELETKLLEAKIESEKSNQNVEQMYEDVLAALRSYGINHDK